MNLRTVKAAFVTSLPVLMGYTTMGAAFGILLGKETGYGPLWALLMSVTILSGSLQFAAVGMIASGMTLLETAVLSMFINIRYCMYGLSMIEPFRSCGLRRFYMIFTLTDETYALQLQDKRPPEVDRNDYMFLIGLLDHIYWIVGCVAGGCAGMTLKFNAAGIDFAMTALFLVILTEQCMVRSNRRPAIIGFAATAGCLWLFGANNMLLPAMLLILSVLIAMRKHLGGSSATEAKI